VHLVGDKTLISMQLVFVGGEMQKLMRCRSLLLWWKSKEKFLKVNYTSCTSYALVQSLQMKSFRRADKLNHSG
jgi:hypothetical protein